MYDYDMVYYGGTLAANPRQRVRTCDAGTLLLLGSGHMAKKGELSKTARNSMGQRDDTNFLTSRTCTKCGELIMLKELLPVKVVGQGMAYYHKTHFTVG